MSKPTKKSVKELYEYGALSTGDNYFFEDIEDKRFLSDEDIDTARAIIDRVSPAQAKNIESRLAKALNHEDYDAIYHQPTGAAGGVPNDSAMCAVGSPTYDECNSVVFIFFKKGRGPRRVYILQDQPNKPGAPGIWRLPRHKFHPSEYNADQVIDIALKHDFAIDSQSVPVKVIGTLNLRGSNNYICLVDVTSLQSIEHTDMSRYIKDQWVPFDSWGWDRKAKGVYHFNSLTRQIISRNGNMISRAINE